MLSPLLGGASPSASTPGVQTWGCHFQVFISLLSYRLNISVLCFLVTLKVGAWVAFFAVLVVLHGFGRRGGFGFWPLPLA